MTRINVGICPEELPSKLLLAEHREITRIPNAILNKKVSGKIPDTFTLGKGHVCFFYNKIQYLHERYNSLYLECCKRGFNVTQKSSSFEEVQFLRPTLYNSYIPSLKDRQLLVERIESKGFFLMRNEIE